MKTFARRDLLAAFLLLLIVLILGSSSRRVGDGGEYLDMAESLAAFRDPTVYAHFWGYPALAVPLLWVLRLAGANPFLAFTAVNLALLATAFWVASDVLSAQTLALLFVCPILWWIDKPHTEVFTFSLLTIAFAAMRTADRPAGTLHPGWTIACLGIAGTQNPPITALALLAIPLLVATGHASLRDRRFVLLSAAGLFAAALHPIYYSLHRRGPFPLAASTHGRIPNIDELTAVVRDTNIGLIANAPPFALAIALVVIFLLVRAPRKLLAADIALALCAAATFLASFAQTTNINSGGTPGMSRYALWLIPLALPFLRRFDAVARPPAWQEATIWLVIVSSVWSLAVFHPRWPEDNATPTRLATWLWTHYPGLDRPVPEVFVERLGGGDVDWWLPMATSQCEKILLTGRGPDVPIFPIPCPPTPVPPECTAAGTLCYANRSGTGYRFAKVPQPGFWGYRFDQDGVWNAAEMRTVGPLLERMKWWEMRVCFNEIVRSMVGMDHQRNYCSNDRLIVYMRNVRAGAALRIRLPAQMSGAFVDGMTGQELAKAAYAGEAGEMWDVPVPAPRESVVLLLRR